MTRESAYKYLNQVYLSAKNDGYREALSVALAALRHQIWEEQLWHDAKKDPPKTPGLYYGKKDDTNSMYACQYRDGVWVLDMYPQQKMDIMQWADYTAFARENEETALRPVSREQVERILGTWEPFGGKYLTRKKCSRCGWDGQEHIKFYSWCPNCGSPMTDEAVEIRLKELEALHENRD